MQTRTIGNATVGTVEVGAIGLGEMPMSLVGRRTRSRAAAPVHAVLDAGMSPTETADA